MQARNDRQKFRLCHKIYRYEIFGNSTIDYYVLLYYSTIRKVIVAMR